MSVKIEPTLGTLINENEEGINEYFYYENPPPSVETPLPPMQEFNESDFPPDNMLNNPLQPAPPNSHDAPDASDELDNFIKQQEQINSKITSQPDQKSIKTNKPTVSSESTAVKPNMPIRTLNNAEQANITKPQKETKSKSSSQKAANILNPTGY